MKNIKFKTNYIEAACYGMIGFAAALLFVFGAMYPDCVYIPGSYIYEGGIIEEPVYQMDKRKVKISIKLYESMQNLFEKENDTKTGETEDDKRRISECQWYAASGRRTADDRNNYDWELL